MPRVAVITPTYNRGSNGLLEKTMLSVLGQTYIDFVHIIVDDGSTDNTPDVVDRYARGDGRVAYCRRERTPQQKFGASAARNYGIESLRNFSDAEFVTFLDSDDLYARHALERRLEAMECPNVRMVYSWLGAFRKTCPLWTMKGPDTKKPCAIAKELTNKTRADFPNPTLFLTTQLLEEVGRFDENIAYGEDRDFSIRVLEHLREGEMIVLPEVLQYYRLHDEGVCEFYRKNNRVGDELAYLSDKHRRTRTAAAIETAKRAVTRPHSFLPESIKKYLRPVRDTITSMAPGFDIDPFIIQIETRHQTA